MQKEKKTQSGALNGLKMKERWRDCGELAVAVGGGGELAQPCRKDGALVAHAKKQLKCAISLKIHPVSIETDLLLPLMEGGVSAGFPSPAADFLDASIDLNQYLIKHPSTTFLAITSGFSMKDAGIHDKDILIIDKSLEPTDGKIAVCIIDGEFVLKRLKVDKLGIWLMPANPNFKPMRISEFQDFEIWGIVTYSIQKH
jgi:DNA polymerase V